MAVALRFPQVAAVQENTRYKAVTASSLDKVAERHPRLAEHLEDIKLSVSPRRRTSGQGYSSALIRPASCSFGCSSVSHALA